MRGFMIPCLMLLALASFPGVHLADVHVAEEDVKIADDLISIWPRYCVSDCSPKDLVLSKEYIDEPEIALKENPEIQEEIARLEVEHKEFEILPISRCPCSTCKSEQERLHTCGRCRIIWPYGGIVNTKCTRPNSYCHLGCGCPGRCLAGGQRYQTVVLYCPGAKPPFVIKKVRTCTNCCCMYSNIYG